MQRQKNWCPAGMTLSSFSLRDQFVTVIYNPSAVHVQNYSRIAIQMKSEEESKTLLKNMTAVVWNRESQAFLDIRTESMCNKKPYKTELFECEINILYPIQPLSYEIVKVIYKEKPEGENSEEDEDCEADPGPQRK